MANRVKIIRANSDIKNWFHVKTKENPGDLVSRGIRADEIVHNSLWWHGPFWLRAHQENWPKPMKLNQLESLRELAEELKVHSITKKDSDLKIFVKGSSEITLMRYSNNLGKLLRILAYVFRFIEHCKAKEIKPKRAIARGEISGLIGMSLQLPNDFEKSRALNYFIKIEQSKVYGKELTYFNERNTNPNSTVSFPENSKLVSLRPYLDENGIIRVGGRLASAQCNEDSKHPVIVPYESRLSELIINEEHLETDHGPVQQIMQYVRTNYWINCLRNEARKHVHKCVICARYNKKCSKSN